MDPECLDVQVILRSAHERTEALSKYLVEQQVPAEHIQIIHERPFSRAVEKSIELGISSGLQWTLCIDADVLIRPGSISDLIQSQMINPSNQFGGSGFIFDKLRGGWKRGGLHLYRTGFLERALQNVHDISDQLRPETYVKNEMENQGFGWGLVPHVLGVHDFEQYYRDIFRKMVVRSYKSLNEHDKLIHRAMLLAKTDDDFKVMVWGLRVAAKRDESPRLDAMQWRDEIDSLLAATGLKEKDDLPIQGNENLVEQIIANQAALSGISNVRKLPVITMNNVMEGTLRFPESLTWQIGWFLTRMGIKIQLIASRKHGSGFSSRL